MPVVLQELRDQPPPQRVICPHASCELCNSVTIMTGSTGHPAYEPLNLARLGGLMVGADDSLRWRLIAEFLEDYRHEPSGVRLACWKSSRA